MTFAPSQPTSVSPASASTGEQHGRWQLRLAISIPALLVLFTLTYGLVSYQLFSAHWDEFERSGAGAVASRLLRAHLYAMIGFSALAMATGIGLALTILKPIRAIDEAARVIASGRLDLRAPRLGGARELGDLSRSFNSMIDFVNKSIQERNRYLLEGITSGLMTLDAAGVVTAINTTGSKILGIDASRIVGRSAEELLAEPDAVHACLWRYLLRALRGGEATEPEEVLLDSPEGPRSLLVAVSVLGDPSLPGSVLMLNFRDAARIRSLNEQLTKTDQLAALGTFTMGLAHELRNPLGAIKGMMQLLEMDEGPAVDSGEIVKRVVHEVDRLDLFVRELLDFSNQSPSPPVRVDLRRTLGAALHLARPETDSDFSMEIVEDYAEGAAVLGEADRLAQAFANIIRNGLEAASSTDRLTLTVRIAPHEVWGKAVEVRIANTGSTIGPADRDRIFDPFFTTKDDGSGLGLAVAYQIVVQNHGTLDVKVAPDEVVFVARFAALEDTPADRRVGPERPVSELAEGISA